MKKKEELYSCSQQDHNAMAETDIKMVPIADLHDFEEIGRASCRERV